MAVCPDTPEEIRSGRAKHGARAILLSDPELELTDRLNLRNRTNLAPPRDGRRIRPLPIPTTFLVDAAGRVRWIDQAEDYQVRSHPSRVLEAIHRVLDD